MDKDMLVPGEDHPITVTPTGVRVVVRVNDAVIADTTKALTLTEASYPAVQYVPLNAFDPATLRRTDTATYCPYKGDASYRSVVTPSGEVVDAAWTYQQHYPAVAQIAGHLAFYPDRATVSVQADA